MAPKDTTVNSRNLQVLFEGVIKDLRWGNCPRLSRWVLNTITSVPIREREGALTTDRRADGTVILEAEMEAMQP